MNKEKQFKIICENWDRWLNEENTETPAGFMKVKDLPADDPRRKGRDPESFLRVSSDIEDKKPFVSSKADEDPNSPGNRAIADIQKARGMLIRAAKETRLQEISRMWSESWNDTKEEREMLELAFWAINMLDPTGISNWPGVVVMAKAFVDDPTWWNGFRFMLAMLAVIPVAGKVAQLAGAGAAEANTILKVSNSKVSKVWNGLKTSANAGARTSKTIKGGQKVNDALTKMDVAFGTIAAKTKLLATAKKIKTVREAAT